MTTSSRWAMKLSVMALALSVMAIFWVWAVKTTPCAGAQATCPIALTRVISQGLTVNDDAADSDSRLEGDTNANLQYWDAGADSIGLGAVVTTGAFATLTGYTTNRAGVTSVGRELHSPAGTFTQTNAASTTLAVGARGFIGAPTFAGSNATQVITDAFNYVFAAPAAGTNMTLTRAYTVGMNAGTTGTLWLSRDTDSTTVAGGLLFGLSRDTNLYRSAADTLRTDDALVVGSTLTASSGGSLTGTWSNLGTVTTVDINGGTLDGTVIGGASAAAGTFTTGNFSGDVRTESTTAPQFIVDHSDATAGQSVGAYLFQGNSDFTYGQLSLTADNISAGTQAGTLNIGVATGGSIATEYAFTASAANWNNNDLNNVGNANSDWTSTAFRSAVAATFDSSIAVTTTVGIGAYSLLDETAGTSVSTGATTIFASALIGGANIGNLTLVSGTKVLDGSIQFTELVLWMTNGGTPTVVSTQTRGAPDTRTYSVSGANLQLAMGANTYGVSALNGTAAAP